MVIDVTILFMEGKINKHLKEVQETATKRVNDIITELKAGISLTEDMKDPDPLYWAGTMNVQLKGKQKKLYIMK